MVRPGKVCFGAGGEGGGGGRMVTAGSISGGPGRGGGACVLSDVIRSLGPVNMWLLYLSRGLHCGCSAAHELGRVLRM